MRTLALLLLVSPLFAADYDVLVRNARVIDGSGNPWFRADLAVKDGRIAAIGRLPTATATRTIDARERVLAPGFIDVHTHIEGGVEKNPRGDNFLLDGVTTVITGNCGVTEPGVGNPHPRSYGTNARVLAEYVRARGVLTLEDAVRRMTSLPARTFRLHDRGLLREGMVADLVLFDPVRVQDKSTYAQPHQYSQGFDFVLVNGQIVVDDGKLTAARPGQPLRHRP